MASEHRWIWVAAAGLVFGGCEDMGLRGARLLPLEEAEARPVPGTLGAAGLQAERPHGPTSVRVAGRSWTPTGERLEVPADGVRLVGRAGGVLFYALAWDQAPYDRLLVSHPGGWLVWAEVVGAERTTLGATGGTGAPGEEASGEDTGAH